MKQQNKNDNKKADNKKAGAKNKKYQKPSIKVHGKLSVAVCKMAPDIPEGSY